MKCEQRFAVEEFQVSKIKILTSNFLILLKHSEHLDPTKDLLSSVRSYFPFVHFPFTQLFVCLIFP